MVTFDHVLERLVAACERWEHASSVSRWCAVRDLRGRIRVVIEPKAAPPGDARSQLEASLTSALGNYFAPPVIATTDSAPDRRRLARAVLDRAEPWSDAWVYDSTGGMVPALGVWLRFERRLSKIEWLEGGAPRPPWPLTASTPIVTFYSFKGGVGRTTALVACAWQLAQRGKRVAVVDLDLEAPGLGSTLGADTPRGVIDFAVDQMATGRADLEGMPSPARELGADADQILVFPAGRLGRSYLDKLARLDFAASTAWQGGGRSESPTGEALRELILAIGRSKPRPDYIFLDSRAGLHDLAGLSLHGLAHVDVLLSKAGNPGYRGLDLAVEVLTSRRGADLSCVVVHAMAPLRGTPEARREAEEFRVQSYEIFRRHLYGRDDYEPEVVPGIESTEDPHSPWILHFDYALQRFETIADRREVLFGEDFISLRARIEELCEPEDDATVVGA